jgi:adenylate cyclase
VAEERAKRKLSAILSADVKGYSRLMGEDELATVETLKQYRQVMTSLIQQYRGRVVDSPGDNMLAEFRSVVDAVESAVEIQKQLKTRNAELPENRRMLFRIGINLGDVIEEGERIYGDGVNIAARVEGLAEGGEICISSKAYEEVRNKVSLGYEYLGEHSVKNISGPVRVYRVLTEPEAAGKIVGEKRPRRKRWQWAALAGVVALAAVAVAIWNFSFRHPPEKVAAVEKMAFPLPNKPSIAVLPFANMSGDPEQEYFCDGITEQIITGLSTTPKLFVIARNSTFTYKGKVVKVQQVAEELGVQYVLGGSVQKAEDKVRISTQLVDALTANHLWAEHYDRELKDIFALQDEITMNVITALRVKLTEGEQARVLSRGTDNLGAYLKLLQARELIFRFNKDDNALARLMLEEVIALDPEYAYAYVALGGTHMMDVWLKSSKSPQESFSRAIELTQKGLALDDSIANTHSTLGLLYGMTGQYEKAIGECERALELGPNDEMAHRRLGIVLSYVGRNEEAIPLYEKAIRLNPFPQSTTLFHLGLAYLFTGRCEEGIATCKKAVQAGPDNLLAHVSLTAVYGSCGRVEEARATAAEVLRIGPTFSVEDYARHLKFKEEDKELIIAGLRKAGLK